MPRRFVFPYPRRRFFSSASPRMDDVPLPFGMPLPTTMCRRHATCLCRLRRGISSLMGTSLLR